MKPHVSVLLLLFMEAIYSHYLLVKLIQNKGNKTNHRWVQTSQLHCLK
jgi:hypothetical protein